MADAQAEKRPINPADGLTLGDAMRHVAAAHAQAEKDGTPWFPGWDDRTDWEAEARAASGIDEPPYTGPDALGPADQGAC